MSRSIEDALTDLERAVRRVREALAPEHTQGPAYWDRQMLSVLLEVEKRGGRVDGDEFLNIGERFGYQRRGMAGFYQQLVRREGNETVMTDEGRARLASLRTLHDPLPPVDLRGVSSDADPFLSHLRADRPGSGSVYDAESAKRDLYRS